MNTDPAQPKDESLEKTTVDWKRFLVICMVLLVGICSLVTFVGGFLLLGSNIDRVTQWTENMPASSALPLVALFMGALLLLVLGPLFMTVLLLYRRRVKLASALPPVDIPGGDPVQRSRRKGMTQVAIGLTVWAVGGCLASLCVNIDDTTLLENLGYNRETRRVKNVPKRNERTRPRSCAYRTATAIYSQRETAYLGRS